MTVGETLRRERIKRNLELGTISNELKISARFLEAIEDEDFDKLPGGVFARAFVRQYGSLLGLNGEELAAQLQQILEPPPAEVVEAPRPAKNGLAPIQVPRMEEWQSVGDQRFRWSGSLSAAIVVVVVMLVCSGVYTWLQQRPHNPISARNEIVPAPTAVAPPSTPPQTTPAQPAAPPVVTASTTEPQSGAAAAPVQAEASSVPPAAKPEAAPPPPPNPDATVHLEITASEPVWVLARTDGKFAFTGTMEANQTRSVEGVRDVVIRFGNAGGVTIVLNGKPIGPVGPKGQPRTVQFTSGGFQIVPAKPPSDEPGDPIARL